MGGAGEGERCVRRGDRGDEKIRRGVNGPLNGLGGSKHCQREEINGKLVADNPPSVLRPLPPATARYSDFPYRVFARDENNSPTRRQRFREGDGLF